MLMCIICFLFFCFLLLFFVFVFLLFSFCLVFVIPGKGFATVPQSSLRMRCTRISRARMERHFDDTTTMVVFVLGTAS